MYSSRDDSSRNAAPTLEAEDALREHDDALSGSAKTMEDTKKLLEETAAGASRLLEMNRRLREELDAARAERDAARAEAREARETETRANANANAVASSGAPPEDVAALRAALAEAERNLRTVSAGFSLLRREREEALNVLKGSEATRAALDEERAAVARVREAMTPTTSSKPSDPASDDGWRAGKRANDDSRDLQMPLFPVAEEAVERGAVPPREPTSAGLSAATGARVSDDEEVHLGSARGDASDSEDAAEGEREGGFSFAAPSDVVPSLRGLGDARRPRSTGRSAERPESAPPSDRVRTNSAARRGEPTAAFPPRLLALDASNGLLARRPVTARGGRAGSLGDADFSGVATDDEDASSSGSDRFDLRADIDARAADARRRSRRDDVRGRSIPSVRESETLRKQARHRRRVDRVRSRAVVEASGASGARDARADRAGGDFSSLAAQARAHRRAGGSRVSSRVSSRAGTPAASPVKRSASRSASRRDGEGLRGTKHGLGEEAKPAFRPAGVAKRAVPAELLTGATLGAAARRLAAADVSARFARGGEGENARRAPRAATRYRARF